MNEDYVRGFMQKAAELGIDPGALAKAAGRGAMAMKAISKLKPVKFAPVAKRSVQTGKAMRAAKPYTVSPQHELFKMLSGQQGFGGIKVKKLGVRPRNAPKGFRRKVVSPAAYMTDRGSDAADTLAQVLRELRSMGGGFGG
jgi:uncharacterized protein (DUF1501 family)